MTEVAVRDARPGDAEVIAAIHVAAWEATYRGTLSDQAIDARAPNRFEYWRGRLNALEDGEFVLVVEEAGRVRGFAHCTPSDAAAVEGRRAALWRSFYLEPGATGRGLAGQLRTAGIERLYELGYDDLQFWVVAGNDRAESFFRTEPTGEERLVADGAVRELLHRVDIPSYRAAHSARSS